MGICHWYQGHKGKTHLSILPGETSLQLGRLGLGVLLLDVSIKMEIIDFPLPKIKQKLPENIITPKKCVIRIGYVQPSSQFARMILGACFG